MKLKRIIFIIVVLILFFPTVIHAAEPEIMAEAAILMDGESRQDFI